MNLLSIVIPFHNSAQKSKNLLNSLVLCLDSDVEIICVDDGSSDNTRQLLHDFQKIAACSVKVIEQENRGPGGARNTGLNKASGKYIWFVDSDDNINVDAALLILRKNENYDPDFIDYNIKSGTEVYSSMKFTKGYYTVNENIHEKLVDQFGRIFSKIFHRRIFNDPKVRYPEYCIYEDNALLFILPSRIQRFVKSEECCYFHDQTYDSITRGKRTDRYFDRMITACWGFSMSLEIENKPNLRDLMQNKFLELYLIRTGIITRTPSLLWFEKLRVMKQFRDDSVGLGIHVSRQQIFFLLSSASFSYRLVFLMLFHLSALLPSQQVYFRRKRDSAWGRPPLFHHL